MKRFLLDTSIYGEIVFDKDSLNIIKKLQSKAVAHGFKVIGDELRQTPKTITYNGNKLRISLLIIYGGIIKNSYPANPKLKVLADEYYQAYKNFGGSKGKKDILNDLLIVACASVQGIDIVASEDSKTLLSENALKSYKLVNGINKLICPNFIGYLKLKKWLSE